MGNSRNCFIKQSIATYTTTYISSNLHFIATLKQLAAILNASEPKVDLQFHRIQFQTYLKKCGIYALSFVTDLSHGIDPSSHSDGGPRPSSGETIVATA